MRKQYKKWKRSGAVGAKKMICTELIMIMNGENPCLMTIQFLNFWCLESFQAGLSWYTILKKREKFKNAFDDFNYLKIAEYTAEKTEELMQNPGIIRNRLENFGNGE